jgi:hypothetical protein
MTDVSEERISGALEETADPYPLTEIGSKQLFSKNATVSVSL